MRIILNAWDPYSHEVHLGPLTNDVTNPECHSIVFFVPMVLQALFIERSATIIDIMSYSW